MEDDEINIKQINFEILLDAARVEAAKNGLTEEILKRLLEED